MSIQDKINTAIWIGKSLFDRGKVSGSSANMSFLHEGTVYITGSGTCFGKLSEESFSQLTLEGEHISGIKPSKEFPLHQMLYQSQQEIETVIHTHSTYATIWACKSHSNPRDVMPSLTPYLKMRVGRVQFVPYAKPGSQELFHLFRKSLCDTRCYLLENHGPIVGNSTLMQAFCDIEELEETAKISYMLELLK